MRPTTVPRVRWSSDATTTSRPTAALFRRLNAAARTRSWAARWSPTPRGTPTRRRGTAARRRARSAGGAQRARGATAAFLLVSRREVSRAESDSGRRAPSPRRRAGRWPTSCRAHADRHERHALVVRVHVVLDHVRVARRDDARLEDLDPPPRRGSAAAARPRSGAPVPRGRSSSGPSTRTIESSSAVPIVYGASMLCTMIPSTLVLGVVPLAPQALGVPPLDKMLGSKLDAPGRSARARSSPSRARAGRGRARRGSRPRGGRAASPRGGAREIRSVVDAVAAHDDGVEHGDHALVRLLPHELALEDRPAPSHALGRDDLDLVHVPRPDRS